MRLAILLACVALAACSSKTATSEAGDNSNDPVIACVERGVAYYKEIGSYPTLQSAPNAGRAAEDVALERCQRTTTAF